jgi:hypothetical protein
MAKTGNFRNVQSMKITSFLSSSIAEIKIAYRLKSYTKSCGVQKKKQYLAEERRMGRGGCGGHSAQTEKRRLSDRWRTLTQFGLTNISLTINFIFLSVKRVCRDREFSGCGEGEETKFNSINGEPQ